jgi:hypothetical protein
MLGNARQNSSSTHIPLRNVNMIQSVKLNVKRTILWKIALWKILWQIFSLDPKKESRVRLEPTMLPLEVSFCYLDFRTLSPWLKVSIAGVKYENVAKRSIKWSKLEAKELPL